VRGWVSDWLLEGFIDVVVEIWGFVRGIMGGGGCFGSFGTVRSARELKGESDEGGREICCCGG